MKNQNLIERLNNIAQVDNSWQDDVIFYEKNKEWLDYSAKIAVLILRILRKNKEVGKFPSSQKDLAEVMDVSPQQINKYVRGTENLTLETILRISHAIGNQLIGVGSTSAIIEQPQIIIATQAVTSISSLNQSYIIPSNTGGFIYTTNLKSEVSSSQSNTNAEGNTQYAMAA